MEGFITQASNFVWSPALVALCLLGGLWFSVRGRFLQLRLVGEMIRLLFQKKVGEVGISSFQALTMTLAGRVGTGNIAGVATAICFGGPGALFWMWVVAFLGASSAFVESTLGQVYKVNIDGEYRGGPAYYIEKGLHSKPFAVLFAVVTVLAAGFLCPGVQGNSITSAFTHAFGLNTAVSTVFVISLLCFIIFGGITRIAQFTVVVVPFMAQIYIVAALIIVGVNIDKFPAMLQLVFSSAFGVNSMFGAMLGTAVTWGVKRGLYSNEAGQGTGPHASSAAAVSHPAKQGLVQAFSVYIDTLFVCSATGFMILLTGCYNVIGPNGQTIVNNLPGVEVGPAYTQAAVETLMPGWGSPFVALALFFFAFTTIIAYYYQAETNIVYLFRGSKRGAAIFVLRVIFLVGTAYSSMKSADLAWAMGDIGIGMMAWVNFIAILLLQGIAFKCLRDYEEQKHLGLDPTFDPAKLGITNAEYWTESQRETNTILEKSSGVDNRVLSTLQEKRELEAAKKGKRTGLFIDNDGDD